jgi:CMP-N-acetylneuraminic acid synthetase
MTLGLIPARCGSKGIKNKNIIDLCGKPLIAYTIEAALLSKVCDVVMVSTDSQEIAEVSVSYGASVPFFRSASTALDESSTLDAVLEVIDCYNNIGQTFQNIILLQPTSPLRTAEDIKDAYQFFQSLDRQGVASVNLTDESILHFREMDSKQKLCRVVNIDDNLPRQKMKKTYYVNGAIYINRASDINENLIFNQNPYGYLMNRQNSVDIDSYQDLNYAKYLLQTSDAGWR